jgi:hypothetical protein
MGRHYSFHKVSSISLVKFFFSFLYWRYNPLWVLAFSVIFFHSALSSHCFFHRLNPIICKSSSMPAIHLFCCLPLVLVPIGFHCNTHLCVFLSSIRITWPSQAILLLFINLTISAFPISSFSSWFILILQDPSSFCTGPKIFLNILRSDFTC